VAVDGQPAGPFTAEELKRKAQAGDINRSTLLWKEDMPQWAAAGGIPELGTLFADSGAGTETEQGARYHVAVNGFSTGPFTMEELKEKAASGALTKTTQVWKSGMTQWAPAGSVRELDFLFP
jgi:hypothetical protein